jgi:hypothetical protein
MEIHEEKSKSIEGFKEKQEVKESYLVFFTRKQQNNKMGGSVSIKLKVHQSAVLRFK